MFRANKEVSKTEYQYLTLHEVHVEDYRCLAVPQWWHIFLKLIKLKTCHHWANIGKLDEPILCQWWKPDWLNYYLLYTDLWFTAPCWWWMEWSSLQVALYYLGDTSLGHSGYPGDVAVCGAALVESHNLMSDLVWKGLAVDEGSTKLVGLGVPATRT